MVFMLVAAFVVYEVVVLDVRMCVNWVVLFRLFVIEYVFAVFVMFIWQLR